MPVSMQPSATAATASSVKPTRNTSPRPTFRWPELVALNPQLFAVPHPRQPNGEERILRVARTFVMAGLVAAIHVFLDLGTIRRGCPVQGRACILSRTPQDEDFLLCAFFAVGFL